MAESGPFFNSFQEIWLNINILPGDQQTAGTVRSNAYQRMRTAFAQIGPADCRNHPFNRPFSFH
ncbi:MAG TPA: hypothetical protein DCP64_02040 [Sarcina sp.]|nr:hypothetical protein [Sarcina sp.]